MTNDEVCAGMRKAYELLTYGEPDPDLTNDVSADAWRRERDEWIEKYAPSKLPVEPVPDCPKCGVAHYPNCKQQTALSGWLRQRANVIETDPVVCAKLDQAAALIDGAVPEPADLQDYTAEVSKNYGPQGAAEPKPPQADQWPDDMLRNVGPAHPKDCPCSVCDAFRPIGKRLGVNRGDEHADR